MGSVSGDTDDRTLELFSDLEAPPINDGIVEITFRTSKEDGYPVWTQNKSKLIERYVYYFLMVTKHGTYIDGFAGPQVEEFNDTSWSAKRVLEIEPQWLRRFVLCDKSPEQVGHLRELARARTAVGDKRRIDIHHGDFNTEIDKILTPNSIGDKEATFCLLDQRTFECKWDTVRKIAQYKPAGRAKIEQFYFLAVGWLGRSIAALKNEPKLRSWWGREDVDLLRATTNTVELARLFSHRFIKELRYASAAAWPIYQRDGEDAGKVMYFMIHATDHPEAPKLMNRAYRASTLARQPMDHVQTSFAGDGFELDTAPSRRRG